MLSRYKRQEMADNWSEENFFRLCFLIEAYAAEALAKQGKIPQAAVDDIWAKGKFDLARIAEIERETKHQFIAFLSCVGENIGDNARFLHLGMTSSDVLDTAFALQMKKAAELLIQDAENICGTLRDLALKYKDTLCIGRTHGIHAEPTTFGLKMLGFYQEWQRNLARLKTAKDEVSVAAISGAVGNFANVDIEVEEYVASKLGLKPEPVSTQVLPRDRFAAFFACLGVAASSMERLATEIRHLQRTEVGEAAEFFATGQKGSSAMPHKNNPILSENLCGLARVVRASVIPALEDVVLWHERDMSHSSVERFIAPDATVTLDFALHRLDGILKGLIVNKEKMLADINLQKGLIFSQRVLLAAVDKGMARDTAYKYVQAAAMAVLHGDTDFKTEITKQPELMKILSPQELDALFELGYYTKNTDKIFARSQV